MLALEISCRPDSWQTQKAALRSGNRHARDRGPAPHAPPAARQQYWCRIRHRHVGEAVSVEIAHRRPQRGRSARSIRLPVLERAVAISPAARPHCCRPPSAITRSALPSPLMSATETVHGVVPALTSVPLKVPSPTPCKIEILAVCYRQVENSIPVKVSRCDAEASEPTAY